MGRIFIGILAIAAFVAGSPYAALAINSVMGTTTISFVDYDGSQQTLTSGRGAPQPDWMPQPPGAHIVSAARWAPSSRTLDSGGSDVLTHSDTAEIASFYTQELKQRGFSVKNEGLGPLDPNSAAMLGMELTLTAERPDTGHEIAIHVRTPSGLILRPRIVQVQWSQLNAEQRAARDALRQRAANMRGRAPGQ